jgi:hypothetical protein
LECADHGGALDFLAFMNQGSKAVSQAFAFRAIGAQNSKTSRFDGLEAAA